MSDWSSLPDLLLDLILSNLSCSLQDCLALAATCRLWRSTAKQSKVSINTNWLMSGHTEYIRQTADASAARVLHDPATSKQFRLDLPEIAGFMVFGSRYGWIVAVCTRTPRLKLLNPISRASIPLPDTNGLEGLQFRFLNAGLTATPGDPDCWVFLEYGLGKVALLKPGSKSHVWWCREDTTTANFDHRSSKVLLRGDTLCYEHGFVHLDGKLYGRRIVGGSYHIVSYDLQHNPPQEALLALPRQVMDHADVLGLQHAVRVEETSAQRSRYMACHLLVMQGQLCLVAKFFSHGNESFIEIFTLHPDTKEWTRVESLGNSCLVVQSKTSLLLKCEPNLIPGCIYYPKDDESMTNLRCTYHPKSGEKVIYYPGTGVAGGPKIWTTSVWGIGGPPPPHCVDLDSEIYHYVALSSNSCLSSYL